MRFYKKLTAILCAFIFALIFYACNKQNDLYTFTAFNTQIIVSVQNNSLSSKIKNQIKDLAIGLEKEFDTKLDGSFVYTFNNTGANLPLSLSDHSLTILNSAKKAFDLSEGKFDPTVFPLVNLWGFAPYVYTPNFNPPEKTDIEIAKNFVDFSLVNIDGEKKTISKSLNGVKMDLGGIVKGYAADKIANILSQNGYSTGYVNVGGSSLNILNVNKLDIRHPRSTSSAIITVSLNGKSNLSVSTSGDYEKFHLTLDGNKYSHLIDPHTGAPANTGIASATLIGIDGVMADALTTALCLYQYFPSDHDGSPLIKFIHKILSQYPTAKAYIVYAVGQDKLIITNADPDKEFTVNDQSYTTVKL